jgi:putative transposase
MLKKINLGYKYRLYPTEDEKKVLNHQMFIYNQAYNICLNLWQKESEKNKKLDKKDRIYRTSTSYDKVVKRVLKFRKLKFSTVVTQQARMNFQKAVKKTFSKNTVAERNKAINKAVTPKEKAKAYNLGFPRFQSSKDPNQSFIWNNQGFSFKDCIVNIDKISYDENSNKIINNLTYKNDKFNILRIMKNDLKFRYHRELPKDHKMCAINFSKNNSEYFVSFNIEFKKNVGLEVSKENLDISKSIGIDLNANNFAISDNNINDGELIDNGSKNRKKIKYSQIVKMLERKQSRRVLKSKKEKNSIKDNKNFKKTQRKINKINIKLSNQKKDLYHKISTNLTNKFELIVVEDLKLKNQMTKSAKGNAIKHGKNVKQKSGLNRVLSEASFYQFVSMIQYKQTMLNDKLFVKVNPKYTSQTCNKCKNIHKDNRKTQSKFKCIKCNYEDNADINASKNIRDKGLQSLGFGLNPQTINESLSLHSLELVS